MAKSAFRWFKHDESKWVDDEGERIGKFYVHRVGAGEWSVTFSNARIFTFTPKYRLPDDTVCAPYKAQKAAQTLASILQLKHGIEAKVLSDKEIEGNSSKVVAAKIMSLNPWLSFKLVKEVAFEAYKRSLKPDKDEASVQLGLSGDNKPASVVEQKDA